MPAPAHPPLTVGLVGCGRWGRHVLRDLRTLGCRVVVAARSDESRANAHAGGAEAVVPTAEALPDVAGVVVASPTVTHADVIEALLPRGVPVFTEKPMTADADRAEALATAAPDRLFVMDKWRYHPGVEALAGIAASGELGRPLGLRTTRTQWGNPHADVDALWILAPHDLAIMLEVLGDLPAPRAAVATHTAGRVTDFVGLLGDDPWGAFEISGRTPGYRREVRLHLEGGVAVLDDGYADAVFVYRDGPAEGLAGPAPERRPVPTDLPLLRELRAFVGHLRGWPPPKSSAADGARIVRAVADLRRLAGLPA